MKSLFTKYYPSKEHGFILQIGNNLISRTWSVGAAMPTISIVDHATGKSISNSSDAPSVVLPGLTDEPPYNVDFESHICEGTATESAHLEACLITQYKGGNLKRVFRVFPDVPFIECTLYVSRGTMILASQHTRRDTSADEQDPGTTATKSHTTHKELVPIMDRIPLEGVHWQAEVVQYHDNTDRCNNLVNTIQLRPYRAQSHVAGNVCFLTPRAPNSPSLTIVKIAPCCVAQSDTVGYDFAIGGDAVDVCGCGLAPNGDSQWVRGYTVALGVSGNSRLEQLQALRKYQKRLRPLLANRDEMVLMNTWGDRARDAHMGEDFALRELECGKALGITHLQLDDGWQKGLSHNSAFGGEFPDVGRMPDYWEPHPKRFPNGLQPIVRKAAELGIELCLWFNPSSANSYESWRKDADIMIGLYKRYGIRTFKIDGLQITDTLCRNRVRAMFEAVIEATCGKVVFNMDVTAGIRFGYHDFAEYGNVFVENRYTDWGNYYPFWTLRNLWQLSTTVPPERLQMEFLNPYRNTTVYSEDDDLAPSKVPMDTSVAFTLMAQPLAWLESTALPENSETARVAKLLSAYKVVQHQIHSGIILPIGFEPDGDKSTGFAVYPATGGMQPDFLLLIAESKTGSFALPSLLTANTKLICTDILTGNATTLETDSEGRILFTPSRPWSFALYKVQ